MSGQTHTVNSDASLAACVSWLTGLYEEHKYLTVAKPRIGRDRSLSQNALLHRLFRLIAADLTKRGGKKFTLETVKDMLKHKYLGYEAFQILDVDSKKWITQYRLKKTSGLSTGEMMFFITNVIDWSISIGINLPVPEDCEYMKLKEKELM